jgi:hypothetical protein
MLAILAAAVLATTPQADGSATEPAFADADGLRFVAISPFAVRTLQSGRHCKGAGRLQTSLAEPALLFRPQDRDAARTRKLIELPPAEACLLGQTPAAGSTGR